MGKGQTAPAAAGTRRAAGSGAGQGTADPTGRRSKVVVIGPMPPPFSGTTVSFRELVRDLAGTSSLELVAVLDTRADKVSSRPRKAWSALGVAARTVALMPQADAVLLNASVGRAVYLGAFVGCVAAVLRRRSVVRVFGGGLADAYSRGGRLFRWATDLLFATSTVLLQSRRLMTTFAATHPRSRRVWFPTNRRLTDDAEAAPSRRETGSRLRFVYAGEVRAEKGIETILEVFSAFDGSTVEIDVYGDLFGPYSGGTRGPESWPRQVRYRGLVDSDALRGALRSYDALLMPTLLESEGYPGVIIEAYGAGVPVICSRIGGIPEIVDRSCGILVEPRDGEGWAAAVGRFAASPELRATLAEGARAKAREFDSERWNREVLGALLRGEAVGEGAA